mgnify:CR=1 FL=1
MLVAPDIKTIQDLQGKKVVTPKGAWASPLTVEILKKNNVTVEFLPDSINVGIEKLQRGDVAAVAYAFAKGDKNIYTRWRRRTASTSCRSHMINLRTLITSRSRLSTTTIPTSLLPVRRSRPWGSGRSCGLQLAERF